MADMRYLAMSITRRPSTPGENVKGGESIEYGIILSYDARDSEDTRKTTSLKKELERNIGKVLYEGPSREEARRLTKSMKKLSALLSEVIRP